MIDLTWDGFLKAKPVKEEWKKRQQEEFAKHLQTEVDMNMKSSKDKEE